MFLQKEVAQRHSSPKWGIDKQSIAYDNDLTLRWGQSKHQTPQHLKFYFRSILKTTTPDIGKSSISFDQVQRRRLGLGVVLVICLVVWLNEASVRDSLLVLLTLSALMMFGTSFVLSRRCKLACMERDKALTQLSEVELKMCSTGLNQEAYVIDCSLQRVMAMQSEIEKLHAERISLKLQAYHDDLTGLANRLLLADRFLLAVERSKRSGKRFTLLMIDLNGFKAINDTHGHAAGDTVLMTMAMRLVAAVRASDTVARLGGDEFVLIIESTENLKELTQISQKLIQILSEVIALGNGVSVKVGASVGLALFPEDGRELNDLLHVADMGMYECKSSGLMSLH